MENVEPSRVHRVAEDEDLLNSGMKQYDGQSGRDARFFLFWATSTSTTTSYTSTSTLASLECTPSGYTLSQCG